MGVSGGIVLFSYIFLSVGKKENGKAVKNYAEKVPRSKEVHPKRNVVRFHPSSDYIRQLYGISSIPTAMPHLSQFYLLAFGP